jgi:sugar phosphate isomerase/epimerase
MNIEHKIELGLSQWSFHRAMLGNIRDDYDNYLKILHSDNPDNILLGELNNFGIVDLADNLNIKHVDLVNILFFSKVNDDTWLIKWKNYANTHGVYFNCLMCDELGQLGASSSTERLESIEKHKRWIDAAAILGCNMVRVNAYGDGTYLQQLHQMHKSLTVLTNYAQSRGIKLVIENHGHPSSNAAWLAMLIESVNHPNLGVYLDYDNFFMGGWHHSPKRLYDRQQGVEDLAHATLGVSAKSYSFDALGNEETVDFDKCTQTLISRGFKGIISVEYEGERHGELEGVKLTRDLLLNVLDIR